MTGRNKNVTLSAPTTTPEGAASDVSDMQSVKTISMSGAFVGSFVIEGSHDAVHYVPLTVFQGSGVRQNLQQSVCAILRTMRVVRPSIGEGTATFTVAGQQVFPSPS